MSRRRVTTARIRAGKSSLCAGAGGAILASVSPAPLREPYAFATLVERPAGMT
ncbi:MAG: hypothetical protein R3F14_42300 [Polyangiaceae bacterium]